MVAVPLGAVNATDIAVSLIAVAIKFVGGGGKVVMEIVDEFCDVPFALVAVRENE
jgi:hypothetical protein